MSLTCGHLASIQPSVEALWEFLCVFLFYFRYFQCFYRHVVVYKATGRESSAFFFVLRFIIFFQSYFSEKHLLILPFCASHYSIGCRISSIFFVALYTNFTLLYLHLYKWKKIIFPPFPQQSWWEEHKFSGHVTLDTLHLTDKVCSIIGICIGCFSIPKGTKGITE